MAAGYDTIHLWTPEQPGKPETLTDLRETWTANGRYTSGNLKNLKVSFSERGTSIKGSWAAYFNESNCYELTFSDTPQAFIKAEDEIEILLGYGIITRIDYGQNIILDHAPKVYYPYLGSCPHLNRIVQPNSVYYQNDSRQFVLYDKKAERRKLPIPDNWRTANVMRAEMRLKKRPHNLLKCPKISVETLSNKTFYDSLNDRFIKEYSRIKKIPFFGFNLHSMKKESDFIKQLTAYAIHQLGVDSTLMMIDELRARDVFPHSGNYSRLKSTIRAISNTLDSTSPSHLIEELSRKIEAPEN